MTQKPHFHQFQLLPVLDIPRVSENLWIVAPTYSVSILDLALSVLGLLAPVQETALPLIVD